MNKKQLVETIGELGAILASSETSKEQKADAKAKLNSIKSKVQQNGTAKKSRMAKRYREVAAVYAKEDPDRAALYSRKADALEFPGSVSSGSGGVTANAALAQSNKTNDQEVSRSIATVKSNLREYEGRDLTADEKKKVTALINEMGQLDANYSTGSRGTVEKYLKETRIGINAGAARDLAEKKFASNREDEEDADHKEAMKAAVAAVSKYDSKVKDAPAQLLKAFNVFSKGVENKNAFAMKSGVKMYIQALDNSAVMGNEMTSLNDGSILNAAKGKLQELFGSGAGYTTNDQKRIIEAMKSIAGSVKSFGSTLQATALQTYRDVSGDQEANPNMSSITKPYGVLDTILSGDVSFGNVKEDKKDSKDGLTADAAWKAMMKANKDKDLKEVKRLSGLYMDVLSPARQKSLGKAIKRLEE